MMKLFAKRPCSFNGKKFFIGDEIPADYVLDPKAQKMMGVIEVVEENSIHAGSVEGGPLLPPSSTLEDEKDNTVYTKTSLSSMNKKNLLAVAADMGVEATAEMNKEQLVTMILEMQGE